ncbi:AAA family ATPase [Flavobacterium sp.]|uniref:AAA family ATPase n=1 Tax=Flavobacterium sp. TaxID=239 RepID=UPI00352905E9
MKKELIVIAGGPSTGKSTLLKALEASNFICYPEISREVIKEAQEQGIDQLFLEDPLLFSEKLLNGRIKQYNEAMQENETVVFLDRGIPDVLAYLNYKGDKYPQKFVQACECYQYSKIFVLPPWQEIYTTDTERYETFEQATIIQQHLINTYESFGYNLIHLPKDTVENRLAIILEHLSK